ncbi:MAG: hypothetical protein ACOC90_11525 [Bacteroidota bacterium]
MTQHNKERLKKLLQYILAVASQSDDYYSRFLSRIHLIKYVYLADLEYARYHGGQTYTGLPWRFYKFGPYCEEVLETIEPAMNEIGAEKTVSSHPKFEDDFIKWGYQADDEDVPDKLREELDIIIDGTIQRMVGKYGADTEGLLHHTYNTVPMLTAAPNEKLDFKTVAEMEDRNEPREESTIPKSKQLTGRQKKKRKEKILAFKEKMKGRKKNQKKKITPSPPRYDEIFYQGLQWLDSLAGEPTKPIKGELIISPEVWKSKSRFDPEGIDGEVS